MKSSTIAFCSALTLLSSLGAATVTWKGGGGNSFWTTTTNWQGGTPPVPGSGDTTIFPGSSVSDFNPDNNIANLGLAELDINTNSNLYTFRSTGSIALTFASGALIQVNQSNVGFVSNFNLPISLAGTTTIDSIGPASSAVTFSQTIGGSGPVNITSSGGNTFTVSLSGSSSYTGGTNLNKGTLAVGNNSALGTGTLTFGGIDGNTLSTMVNGLSLSNPIALSKNAIVNPIGRTITLSGTISGAGSLSTGSGTLVLPNANTYLGGTVIAPASKINIGNNGSLSTGTVTFTGGTLQAGTNGLSVSNPISIAVGGAIDTNGQSMTVTGAISNSGPLTKNGTGTLFLPNANTYLGGTFINLGTLNIGNNGSLGTGTINFFNTGGILQAGAAGLSLSNAIDLQFDGTVDTNGQTLTLTGVISDTSSLTKIGAGTLILTNVNSYRSTFLSQGTLNVQNNSALGGLPLTFNNVNGNILQAGASNLSLSNDITLTNSGVVDTNGQSLSLTGVISDVGSLTKIGSGTLTLSNANTYSGGTIINAGVLAITSASGVSSTGSVNVNASGAAFDISGAGGNVTIGDFSGAAGSLVHLGTRTLTIGTSNSTAFAGTIDGTGGLTKQGSGTATLSAVNTYSGGTIINAGTLAITSTSGVSSTGSVNVNASGAAFDISGAGGNVTIGDFSGATGSLVHLGTRTLTFGTSNSTSFAGSIDGTGGLTKQGSGAVTLLAANTYSGTTQLSLGTLAIGNNASLGTGQLQFVTNNGNTLQAGAAGLSLSNLITLNKNGVVDSNNQTLTLAGNISGPGGLNKIGQGQLILSGPHDFIGSTTVSAGMLTVDGSLQSPVTVLPGSILNGSGSIVGDVVIGGTLGPGDMIGTIEVTGNVTFQTGSTFQVQADPTRADNLDVDASGNITIQPGSTLEIDPVPATYGQNMTYQIASAGESGGVINGTFDTVVNTYPLITAQVQYGTAVALADPLQIGTAAAVNQISMILNFASISSLITQGNPGAIAKSLDGVNPPVGSDMYLVLQQLYFLPTTAALKEALNQMQPSILNSLSLAEQGSNFFVSSVLSEHTSELYLIRSPCTKVRKKRWQVWGDGAVNWARQHGNSRNVGYHAKADLGIVGTDYRITDQFFIGATGAYTHTLVNTTHFSARGRMDTFYAGLYSSYLSPLFFVNVSVLGLRTDYHSKRSVHFGTIDRHPHGHHHGFGLLSHLDFGACLPKISRAQLYPYGKLDYLFQHEVGYTEHKAQSLNNHIYARNTDVLRSELGLQGRYCYSTRSQKSTWIPSAKLGWVRETRFHGQRIHARLVDVPNQYSVLGLYPSRSMLALGATLSAVLLSETLTLTATYEGLFCGKYSSNEGSLALNLGF